MNKIIMLIGTSLSGKTTWAKDYMKNNKNVYYVSRDDERESFFGEYRMGDRREEDLISEIVNHKIAVGLKKGDVIVDNTNLKKEVIDKFIYDFPNVDIDFKVMPLLEKEELIKRNQKRFLNTGKMIPERVIYKQMKSFEELEVPDNISCEGVKVDPRIERNLKYNSDLDDCIIVDLDGTLSLMNGRHPYSGEDCASDVINSSVMALIHSVENFSKVFLFSGRNSDQGGREATEKWLSENIVPYDSLIMREPKDYRPDVVIKKEMYNKHIKDKYNVLFAIDDRDCVVDLWRSIGIDCFQVYYGNF